MNNPLNVLPADIHKAKQHYHCCRMCLQKAGESLDKGQYDIAEKRMEDFRRSMNELKELQEKRERRERLEQTIEQLRSRGIKIDFAHRRVLA